jgi:hypothetical protein
MAAVLMAAGERRGLDQLEWMLGVWQMETPKVKVEETWRKLGDRTFEGDSVTRSKVDGKILARESIILAEMGGEIFYIARPSQNPYPVGFRLVRLQAGAAAFENPQHDFPQKITYSRNQDGSLDASVEGLQNGKTKRISFHFLPAR